MQKLQAFMVVVFLILVILLPCLLLSFFSINALKNEEAVYLRRLEIRYKDILSNLKEQFRDLLVAQEKKILQQIAQNFKPDQWKQIYPEFETAIQESNLFEFPFLLSNTGKRLIPLYKTILLPSADREVTIRTILEPALVLEEENKVDNALSRYREIASLYRNQWDVHLEALFSMGRCYASMGDYSKALSMYQDLLLLYPLEKDGNINFLAFQSSLKIGEIYKQTGNLQKYFKILVEMLQFLVENQESFSAQNYQGLKDDLWGKISTSKMPWTRREMEKISEKEEFVKKKIQFFKLFERRMISYLSERVRKQPPIEMTRSEIRLPLSFSPQNYGRLGHLKASSPEMKGIVFYFVLPHPEDHFILGASIRPSYFLESLAQKKIQELGDDQEVQVELTDREDKNTILAEQTLFYPFEDIFLVASLRDRQLFHDLANLRVKNYLFAISIAIIVVVAGTVGILVYVFQQIKVAQMKSDFVSNVTHELKTPLTSIRMFVETILMGRIKSREEEVECLTIISKETERLSRLIEKILEFSSLENKIKSFRFATCQMEEVIQESVELFKQQVGAANCIFRLNIIQNIQPIRMDKESFKEVFLNLFSNAFKYCEKLSHIVVNLKESKRYVIIEVVDNGVGIPKYHLKKIFQKFYRVHNLLTSNKEGTGLGLAICKSIVKAHRGKIFAESKPGEGSKFIIFLPKNN